MFQECWLFTGHHSGSHNTPSPNPTPHPPSSASDSLNFSPSYHYPPNLSHTPSTLTLHPHPPHSPFTLPLSTHHHPPPSASHLPPPPSLWCLSPGCPCMHVHAALVSPPVRFHEDMRLSQICCSLSVCSLTLSFCVCLRHSCAPASHTTAPVWTAYEAISSITSNI